MPGPYTKAMQTGRAKPKANKRTGRNSTLAQPDVPMRTQSATNSRAVAKREDYLPKRRKFLKAHPLCEMNITTPAICPPRPHPATEVQHMVQVSLDPSIENLLDESHWLASCHAANTYAGTHPVEAQAAGVEIAPNDRRARGKAAPQREKDLAQQ